MNRNQIKSKGFKYWNDYKGKGLKRDEEQQVTNLPGEESHLCCHLTRQWQWHPGKTDWLSWCQILWVNFLKKWAELWLREKLRPKKYETFSQNTHQPPNPFFLCNANFHKISGAKFKQNLSCIRNYEPKDVAIFSSVLHCGCPLGHMSISCEHSCRCWYFFWKIIIAKQGDFSKRCSKNLSVADISSLAFSILWVFGVHYIIYNINFFLWNMIDVM